MKEKSFIKYNQLIIYYFSGTGNAKNAAKWILKEAQSHGLITYLVNIDATEEFHPPAFNGPTLFGFCSPTHGFNMPPIVLSFIFHFPKIKNADVFILNTRGGLKLSRFFLPGLSGIAQIFPALILRQKGFKIIGMQPLDLPSNWLILHPGLKKKVILSIYERCELIVQRFTKQMLHGQTRFKALWSLPIDLLVLPIAIAYYFIGRFFLAKTLIATQACNHCGKCVKKCPVQAISMVGKLPFWSFQCESCMRCINACSQRAIETSHGYVFSLLFLSSFIISPAILYVLQRIGLAHWVHQSIITENLWLLLYSAIFLIIVYSTYKILHFGMRFRYFNLLIRYTSLSSYSFWRRYQAPNQE